MAVTRTIVSVVADDLRQLVRGSSRSAYETFIDQTKNTVRSHEDVEADVEAALSVLVRRQNYRAHSVPA